jgi:hypothetical protein
MRKLTVLLVTAIVLFAAMPAAAARDVRVSVEGRIRSFSHDRDGYRVYLDRGDYSFRVPDSLLGRRSLRVGLEVRFAGVSRNGHVWVDDIGWLSENDRYDDYLRGRVERVNIRDERLVVRDERGRLIEVDGRAVDERHRRLDLGDVHRGDRITLRGRWDHGTFRALRIDSISAR